MNKTDVIMEVIQRKDCTEIFITSMTGELISRSANPNREVALSQIKEFIKEENLNIVQEG